MHECCSPLLLPSQKKWTSVTHATLFDSQPTTGVAEEDLGPLIPVAVGALGGDLVFLRGPHQERHELVLRRQRALLSDARSLAAPRIDRFQVRVSYSYLKKVSEKYEPPTTLHGIMDEE